jgi:TolB-like protein/Tfp pilus assembly protein PilF
VLPFANLSRDPEQEYFVDGVTESLTTDLSRISGSFVIGRHTAFTYKGKAIDLKQIGRELNVRYVLEGSVQRGGDRLRVNVQLVDAEAGAHLWADRFDKRIADLFDLQDEIVAQLANTLRAQLTEAEAKRAKRSPDPNSMDLFFQGRASWNKGWTPESMAQTREFFERALELDPGNVEAMVGLAGVDTAMAASYLTDDRAAHLAVGEARLIKALSLAPNKASAHCGLGGVLVATNRVAQGIAECERALALDRNMAEAHVIIGDAKFFLGRAAETEAHMNEALRLSPRDMLAFRWLTMIAFARLQIDAPAEAVNWFHRSIEANRNYPIAHFGLATTLALLGSLDDARAAAKAGFALDPSFTIRRFRDGASSDNPTYLTKRERVYQGMRMAGVPEG